MAVVIDNFLAAEECSHLLKNFPILEDETRKLFTVDIPLELEKRMRNTLQRSSGVNEGPVMLGVSASSINEQPPSVPFVARLATGSVPMHQDCFNPFDAAETGFIDDYVAVVYLAGAGSFVIDAGDGETAIDILPGRFIAWPNGVCHHRLDAAPDSGARAMLGPVAINADGLMQRAHDVWSTHPGYIGSCKAKAADAEARGDDKAVREALGNIGIPGIAADLLKEYEDRHKEALCLTLTVEPVPDTDASSSILLVGAGMSGERLITLQLDDPSVAKYGQVEKKLCEEVAKVSTRGHPEFILHDGTMLGELQKEITIEDLFDCSKATSSKTKVRL